MKKVLLFLLTSAICHLTSSMYAQFTNVQITACYFGEGCIAIDPNNSSRMVGGANLDYAFYSTDTGATWNVSTINSTYGIYGDPCLVADNFGNFYYSHLSNPIDRIVVQKSTDGGQTWNNGTAVGYWAGHGVDKPWMYYDRATNSIFVTWVVDAYSSNPNDSVVVMLSKSTDGGATFSIPVQVSKTKTGNGSQAQKGSVIATGPAGEIYVGWCGPQGMSFQKSLDGGSTWLAQDVHVDNLNPFWYFSISGYGSWGTAFPSIACDLSGGPNTGNIYFCWSDQRNGASNTDAFMARSTDGGNTWTVTKINDDVTTSHQFHPTVCVDQSSGNVYCVFYDQRNYPSTSNAEMYLAYSVAGGNSWWNTKISTSPMNSGSAQGDYIAVSAENGQVRPIWSGTNDVEWTALINYSQLVDVQYMNAGANSLELTNYPNPFSNESSVEYFIPGNGKVSLKLSDVTGNTILHLAEEVQSEGWHKTNLKIRLAPGIYFLKLDAGNASKVRKMIVAK